MKSSALSHWLSASRPHTLPAAFVPVIAGAAIAWQDGLFRIDTTAVALFCALAIQVGTNFANDYFDYIKGADTEARIGFQRATSTGVIPAAAMRNAAIITMSVAFLAGLYLVWIAGWVVLAIGVASILFGILYTGGPFPLGYNGLGDLFVFIFFGIVAVTGTYYVNALQCSATALWASFPVGALCVNILVVNNLRDIDQDRIARKKTLGVLFGERMLMVEYILMILVAFLTPLYFYYFLSYSIWVLLPYLSLPFARTLMKQVWLHEDKKSLNLTLERTAQFMVMFGILFAAGIII